MASFTLESLIGTQINVGGLTLSDFSREIGTTYPARFILIDTVEGADPGFNVRIDPRVATTVDPTQFVGIDFQVTAPTSILVGAGMSLDGYSFGVADGGGVAAASLTQPRSAPNLDIDLVINNEPGGADSLSAFDDINGGPVPIFKFDLDLALDPNNGVPATFGQTAIRFDVLGGGGGLPAGFDGLQYIASHGDLIVAFGANRAAGEQHFLSNGQAEGRQADQFGETQYLRNYGDLQAAFGGDVNAATTHFISNGFNEIRVDDAPSPAQIDGLQYIASNADLITAFSANAAAGQQHYANFGQGEGRALDNFNETQYLANYADLQAAFGTNTDAATAHFITNGFAEDRNDFLI